MSDIKNQCQGCQAGWPMAPSIGMKLTKGSQELTYLPPDSHLVSGGYKGEIVVCTKDRYPN